MLQPCSHLRNHLAFLQIVSHQNHNGLAAEHKVQHGRAVLEMMPQVLAEEVDVDQVLHGRLANHGDIQLLSNAAACTIRCNQILSFHLIRSALQRSQKVPIGCSPYCNGMLAG